MISHSKPWIIKEDINAVKSCMETAMLSCGTLASEFEASFRRYIGVQYAFAAASGTEAIKASLYALDIIPGDEVILPTYVCKSVADAILSLKAVPIFCDIGEHWHITEESVAGRITEKTKAIIAVHTFGVMADIIKLRAFNIPIIEDCAHSIGSKLNGRLAGTMGDFAIFSFGATKCLTAAEGGMVTTNSELYAARLHDVKCSNQAAMFLSDFQSALGLNQLKRYEEFLKRRGFIAKIYFDKLPIEFTKDLAAVKERTNFYRFPIIVNNIDPQELMSLMEYNGVIARKGVDTLLHKVIRSGSMDKMEGAECLFNKTICLPIYPALLEDEAEYITDCLLRCTEKLTGRK